MGSKIFSFLCAISTFYAIAIYHVATAGRCHEEQKNSSLLVSAQIFAYMRAVGPHQSEMFHEFMTRQFAEIRNKINSTEFPLSYFICPQSNSSNFFEYNYT